MRYSASLAEEVAGVLAATVPLGMPSGKTGHHPGWNHCRDPQQPCPRLSSKPEPAPRIRYEVRRCHPRVFTAASATQAPPHQGMPPRALSLPSAPSSSERPT